MRNILVLYAHPTQERSEVNRHLAAIANDLAGVTLVDLYAEYPNFVIDIDREQERLRAHDVVVFQHPLYWYSTPAILKEWQDLVLEYGFAYGAEGTVLHGKIFFAAITAGGAKDAYSEEGYNHFPVASLLAPLEQTARLCGMTYLPPFCLFNSRLALEDGRLQRHVDEWRALLEALRDQRLDIAVAQNQTRLSAPANSVGGTV